MNRRQNLLRFLVVFILIAGMLGNHPVTMAQEEQEQQQKSDGYSLITDLLTIFPKEQVEKAKAKGYDVRFAKYQPSQYNLEIDRKSVV